MCQDPNLILQGKPKTEMTYYVYIIVCLELNQVWVSDSLSFWMAKQSYSIVCRLLETLSGSSLLNHHRSI